eukprot:m.3472 g.3472  ORF g.3472 m.3472 type:complete len:520 (-) comp2313_c0_seq1:191-1750(-)
MALTRWNILAVLVLVESLGGLFYIFSVYSDRIKTQFDLSQDSVDLIGTASNVGGNIGIVVGMLADRFGPRPTMLLGMLLALLGWIGTWHALDSTWDAPYALLVLFAFLQGHAQMIGDISSIPTVGRNFPQHRGVAIGLCKAFVGLSGALATQIYQGFFYPNVVPFILFLGIEAGAVMLIGAVLMRNCPPTAKETIQSERRISRDLQTGFRITFCLAILLVASAMLEHFLTMSRAARLILTFASLAVFGLLLGFLWTRKDSRDGPLSLHDSSTEKVALLNSTSIQEKPSSGTSATEGLNIPQYNVVQALSGLNLYLIFFSALFGGGAGLLLINNLGQIVPAFGGSKDAQNVFVSLLSVCNCGGRLLAGFAGDKLLAKFGYPRPLVFAVALGIMAISNFMIMSGSIGALFPACVLAGLSYGAFNALVPTLISEIFGLKHFAAVYGTNALCFAIGSYAFATKLAGSVYAHHAPAGSKTCIGTDCYQMSFLITGTLCTLAIALSLLLMRRSRERYSLLYPDYY